MAGLMPGDSSHHQENLQDGSRWYFTRKYIEENSPSRRDGIDLQTEAYLRKSYCSFLKHLGMELKIRQPTIATAVIFCQRFFMQQSHAKNDWMTIATACMVVAVKAKDARLPLVAIIHVSYKLLHKKDRAAVQRIKQEEVYEQQKNIVILGERVVLATLAFDLNLELPYKHLGEPIKKFKAAHNELNQAAWNFVNDGLMTSLCLQFTPRQIAAGAIFLAAKFLKVEFPEDEEKVLWQELGITVRQLLEFSHQMLDLYEQNQVAPSNDVEGTAGGGNQEKVQKLQEAMMKLELRES